MTINLNFAVANQGRGLARYISVFIGRVPNWPRNMGTWNVPGDVGTIAEPFTNSSKCYESTPDAVIHAGNSRMFFVGHQVSEAFLQEVRNGRLAIPYRVACEGYQYEGILRAELDSSTQKWNFADEH